MNQQILTIKSFEALINRLYFLQVTKFLSYMIDVKAEEFLFVNSSAFYLLVFLRDLVL